MFFYLFIKVLQIVLKIVKIATAIIKLAVPFNANSTHSIFKPIIIFSSKNKIIPFITKINNQNVNNIKGNQIIFKIGLTKKFNTQSTTHQMKKSFKSHKAFTSGRK